MKKNKCDRIHLTDFVVSIIFLIGLGWAVLSIFILFGIFQIFNMAWLCMKGEPIFSNDYDLFDFEDKKLRFKKNGTKK